MLCAAGRDRRSRRLSGDCATSPSGCSMPPAAKSPRSPTSSAAMRETVQGIRIVKAFPARGGRPYAHVRRHRFGREAARNKIVRTQARVNPMIETLGGVAVALVVLYAGWRNISYTDDSRASSSPSSPRCCSPPIRPGACRACSCNSPTSRRAYACCTNCSTRRCPRSTSPAEPALLVSQGHIAMRAVYLRLHPRHAGSRSLRSRHSRRQDHGAGRRVGRRQDHRLQSAAEVLGAADRARSRSTANRSPTCRSFRSGATSHWSARMRFCSRAPSATTSAPGWSSASDAEIEAAAKAAHADDFIRKLSRGYDTPVGELGNQISGGQRQRLSIARAFLKNAPIVLLDEATSALDSETEQQIQMAIDRLTTRPHDHRDRAPAVDGDERRHDPRHRRRPRCRERYACELIARDGIYATALSAAIHRAIGAADRSGGGHRLPTQMLVLPSRAPRLRPRRRRGVGWVVGPGVARIAARASPPSPPTS